MSPQSPAPEAPATQPQHSEATASAMERLLRQVTCASTTDIPVTLMGEPGSGKRYFAQAIHLASPWSSGPLVEVACDRSPDIAAVSKAIGSKATLLLLEVGHLSSVAQNTLARVLAEDGFRRDPRCARPRIRLLATTSASLDQAVEIGAFRADLYHRLTVMAVAVPPLRDRREEIATLTYAFLERFAAVHGKRVSRLTTRAMALLAAHSWPGNVQELADVIERAVIVCDGQTVDVSHLPRTIVRSGQADSDADSLEEAMNAYERGLIQNALQTARGSRSKAARLLKTTYRVLHYKTRKHGIDHRQFKR